MHPLYLKEHMLQAVPVRPTPRVPNDAARTQTPLTEVVSHTWAARRLLCTVTGAAWLGLQAEPLPGRAERECSSLRQRLQQL